MESEKNVCQWLLKQGSTPESGENNNMQKLTENINKVYREAIKKRLIFITLDVLYYLLPGEGERVVKGGCKYQTFFLKLSLKFDKLN